MKNDSRAHRAYTPEEISDWIGRYRGSGLALGTFAEQHGLSRNRLHYWVYDRRFSQPRRPAVAAPVFQAVAGDAIRYIKSKEMPAGVTAQ